MNQICRLSARIFNKSLITPSNYYIGPIVCIFRNKWTFRTEYEKCSVKDPDKLRFGYNNIHYQDLFRKRMDSRAGYFLIIVLGYAFIIYFKEPIFENFYGYLENKDQKEIEKKFDAELGDQPEHVRKHFMKSKAATMTVTEEIEFEKSKDDDVKKKNRIGFRDSRIIAYEDRIRAYSTPDKIFRYFGTIQDYNGEIYMTPQDFVRSITPGVKQPEDLGLDSFRKVDLRKDKVKNDVEKDSVFYAFGENAIINFSDYVFLLSVISTPSRQFEIAFRMFDLNGDGELDISEFNVVRSIIRTGSPMGKRHRDNSVTGNTISGDMNSSLSNYFFKKDGSQKLTINDFLNFQAALQKEIMRLEFNRYDPVDNIISEVDFADALLMYAGFSEHKKRKFIRRVKQKFTTEDSKGVTFEEYVNFSHFLRCISDVDTALTFYHLAGASIDPQMFKHVSKAVANVDLSDNLIDIVFTLFDEDNDNHLSNREFISVMKQRLLRGLDKPMDTGFIRMMTAMTSCAKKLVINGK